MGKFEHTEASAYKVDTAILGEYLPQFLQCIQPIDFDIIVLDRLLHPVIPHSTTYNDSFGIMP